ncbi:MAG TPA: hypothetical protein VFH63_01675 [candidate division Zixibacteria bacterium]|nr:hypothetical protein [candidate division Zixibacteria bacterium]
MNPRPLLLTLLAITAALTVAPLPVLAAPPNQLQLAVVAPLEGDASTTFVFSVRYVSTGGNPATEVTATAAGMTFSLHLVAGTDTDGIWTGSATLPPGTWEVRFAASAEHGPRPTISGGTVTVAGASTSPAPGDEPAPPVATNPALAPSDEPVEPPAATLEPAPAAPSADPSTGPVDGTGSGSGGSGGTSGADGGEDGPQQIAGVSPAASASPAPAPAGSATGGPTADAMPADPGHGSQPGADASPVEREQALTWIVLGTGLATAAAVALLGLMWFVRRRREAAEQRAAAAAAIEEQLIARLAERTIRRARVRTPADPILAAMGLEDGPDTPANPEDRSDRSR